MKVSVRPHFSGREPVWEEHKEFYSTCVGKGWQDILDDLTLKLLELGWDGYLEQVKEKFGTLRFYWCNNLEGIMGEIAEDVVSFAEQRTAWTCEECGGNGKLRGDGWVVTLCTLCWEKRIEAKNKLVVNALVKATGWEAPGIPAHDDMIMSAAYGVDCACKGDFTCEAHRA